MGIMFQGDNQLIQYQILHTNIIRIVWQTVRRITDLESEKVNLLTSKSDQHLISPYNITPELNVKVTRIKGMITTLKNTWLFNKWW